MLDVRRLRLLCDLARLGVDAIDGAVGGPVEGAEHVYHLYVVRSEGLEGIGTGYYRVPCHLQPAMREWGSDGLELPGTREAARTNVALPMGKDLTEEQIEEVVRACASGST